MFEYDKDKPKSENDRNLDWFLAQLKEVEKKLHPILEAKLNEDKAESETVNAPVSPEQNEVDRWANEYTTAVTRARKDRSAAIVELGEIGHDVYTLMEEAKDDVGGYVPKHRKPVMPEGLGLSTRLFKIGVKIKHLAHDLNDANTAEDARMERLFPEW